MPTKDGRKDESFDGDALDPETEAELRRWGTMLQRRSPVAGAELDSRIMARIRRTPRARFLSLRAWWLRPRDFTVSPLSLVGGGISAVLLVIALVLSARDQVTPSSSPLAAVASGQVVHFALAAPGVSQVNLVGDFNGWDATATPLRPSRVNDIWVVDVPLTPGRYEYAFVLDGQEWRPDPAAPRAVANEFGTPNSVVTVGAYRL